MIRLTYHTNAPIDYLAKKNAMNLERPSTLYRIMNDLRWTDKFICLKCANTKSIKGDDIYDKKCSKCKKNVSLTKYTAFEGLRFPIEKAYGIIETLMERAQLDGDAKVIKWYNRKHSGRQGYDVVDDPEEYRNPKNVSDEYEYLSVMDLIMRNKKREQKRSKKYNTVEEMEFVENKQETPKKIEINEDNFKEKRIDKLIEEINNRSRPTIGMLAKKFELEENTVSKFLEKITNRMRQVKREEHIIPLNRILEFITHYNEQDHGNKITVKYFLGLAMVPMVGKWNTGLTKIDGKHYGINLVEDGNGEWSVYRVTGTRDEHTYTFQLHERIEYGTQEWYNLFREKIPS